jgi:hypothetical protein
MAGGELIERGVQPAARLRRRGDLATQAYMAGGDTSRKLQQ